MWFFKPRSAPAPAPTRKSAMACVPLRNPEVRWQRVEAGDVMLTYPVVLKPWFSALARRLGGSDMQQVKKLQLDAMGSATWDLVDGKSTVRQIVTRFAQSYQLHQREAEVAVTQFLRELGRRGLIAMK